LKTDSEQTDTDFQPGFGTFFDSLYDLTAQEISITHLIGGTNGNWVRRAEYTKLKIFQVYRRTRMVKILESQASRLEAYFNSENLLVKRLEQALEDAEKTINRGLKQPPVFINPADAHSALENLKLVKGYLASLRDDYDTLLEDITQSKKIEYNGDHCLAD